MTLDTLLQDTAVTFKAAGREVTLNGRQLDEVTRRIEQEGLGPVEEDDVFARSVREETRPGPALPAGGRERKMQRGFNADDDQELAQGELGIEEDETPATPEDLFAAAHRQEQAVLEYEAAKERQKIAKINLDLATWQVRHMYRKLAKQRGIDPSARERR